jgi:hypothetical protein
MKGFIELLEGIPWFQLSTGVKEEPMQQLQRQQLVNGGCIVKPPASVAINYRLQDRLL